MDPQTNFLIIRELVPAVVTAVVFLCPVAAFYIHKHFKLREREIDLEAGQRGSELDSRLRSLETRQAAIESALTAIGNALTARQQQGQPRADLMEPPPLAPADQDPLAPTRTRER
jgi:hypothetical protein